MPRAPSGPQPPGPATVIRAIFNDKRRLSERLSTDTRALTRAHLPLKIARDQLSASGRARSFGRGHRTINLEAFYCQPGITGAHEKGGVEGQIGWFRRNHLVPVPDVLSVEALNAMIG
jgi:hypothetical protein